MRHLLYVLMTALMIWVCASIASAVEIVTTPGADVVAGGKLVTVTAEGTPDGSVLWFMQTDGVDYVTDDRRLHLATPCKDLVIRINCVVIDWESRKIDTQRQITLTVDGDCPDDSDPDDPPDPDDPDPDDPDNPDPVPDGPFDNLARRVSEASAGASASHRESMDQILTHAVEKMRTFEWRQQSQATEYIKRNWPQCAECSKVFDLLEQDASGRDLSWQEYQAYYLEIAKGIQ